MWYFIDGERLELTTFSNVANAIDHMENQAALSSYFCRSRR